MIYRVTLPGYFALHTADSALADAWKNHFGGTVAQIHLGDIKSVSAEMWDGSELSATRIALDRVRAMMREQERQMEEMYKELCAWRGAIKFLSETPNISGITQSQRFKTKTGMTL